MTLSTGFGSGDINLYYKAGSWPDAKKFDQSATGKGNQKQLVITNPDSSIWHYLRVHGQYKDISIWMSPD